MIETAEALSRFEELAQAVTQAIEKGIRGGDARKIAEVCTKTIEYEAKRSKKEGLDKVVKTNSFKAIQFALAAMSALISSPQDPVQQVKNLSEAMKIVQTSRQSDAGQLISETVRSFAEERKGFLSDIHRGLESLSTELKEKYGVTVIDGPGEWRAWRIFLGNLFEPSQGERTKNVLRLAPTPTDEAALWKEIADMAMLTGPERLDLDDLKNNNSPLTPQEQHEAEQTMNRILSTESFRGLKDSVGDRYGAMHLVEQGILNSQTPPELQEQALAALNALGRTDFLDKFKLA